MILALIGIGKWGQNYIKTIESLPNVSLKYICAQRQEKLSLFSSEYIKIEGYQKLAKYKDIDGVIIATPSVTHFEIARFFLEKDFNVLVEKPFTTSYRDALQLENINKKKKKTLMAGHIYLYNPAFVKLVESIEEIGIIKSVNFEFGGYRKDAEGLWDWGSHSVSMSLALIRSVPLGVSAKARGQTIGSFKIYPQVDAVLYFNNNIAIYIKTGWLFPENKREMTVTGEKGVLVFNDLLSKKLKLVKSNKIVSYPSYNNSFSLENQVQEFVMCIKKGKRPKTDGSSAVTVTKVLERIQRSVENNGKIIKV